MIQKNDYTRGRGNKLVQANVDLETIELTSATITIVIPSVTVGEVRVVVPTKAVAVAAKVAELELKLNADCAAVDKLA